MGTASVQGFILDGQEKVMYNNFDGEPTSVGLDLMRDMKNADLNILKNNVKNIILVNDEDECDSPIPVDIFNEVKEYQDPIVNGGKGWYSLLRNVQGTIKPYLKEEKPLRFMLDSKASLYGSFFCEYAYIINLDTGMMEFYKGLNDDPDANGRYARLPDKMERSSPYVGVRLVVEVPLDIVINAKDEQLVEFAERLKAFMSGEYKDVSIKRIANILMLDN